MGIVRGATEAKRTGAHFTPRALADFLAVRLIENLPVHNGELRILDPSCGDGELLRAFVEATNPGGRRLLHVFGVEDNAVALTSATERLSALSVKAQLIAGDFLSIPSPGDNLQMKFDCATEIDPLSVQSVDVVIANPPYVRTQLLGARRAQQLACRYNLKGRVDLYYAFMVAMTRSLKPDGLLGIITSNRFLTTRSGESVRKFLAENYHVIEIIDLGDTKLFEAAVLPAIIVARKSNGRSRVVDRNPSFVKVYEATHGATPLQQTKVAQSVLDIIAVRSNGHYSVDGRTYKVTSGDLKLGCEHREPWRLTTRKEAEWVKRLERAAANRVADVAKVRVGIKTTADKVFIRGDWRELPPDIRPEEELLRPLFTHFDAGRWKPSTGAPDLLRILYTHQSIGGKRRPIDLEKYPRAMRYLESKRDVLESRSYVVQARRKWYEIWVPQDPAAWRLSKIVVPDISPDPKFFFDESGALVNGDCYWIAMDPGDRDVLLLIQGVANSTVMTRYHDLVFNNKLYSGRRRYISQYIERYPLPRPDSPIAKQIIAVVKRLNEAPNRTLENDLNELAAAAFDVAP